MGSYIFEKEIAVDSEHAYGELYRVLRENNWIVLSYVNLKEILEKNFSSKYPYFFILDVCKPVAAKELTEYNRKMGIFLPCKITIEEIDQEKSKVSLLRVSELDRSFLGGSGKIAEKYENELINIINSIEK